MQLVLYHEIPQDEMLREQWNSLVLASEFPQVFYTYEWALALYRTYSEELEPYLWLAYEGGSLLGIASLAKNTVTEKICFLAGTTADYCDFISAPRERQHFVMHVIAELKKAGLEAFSFANLPAQSASIAPLKKLAQDQGYTFFARPAFSCAQVLLTTREQRDELKRTVQGKEMFRRKMKSLKKIGSVTYEHLRASEEISNALPDFFNAQIGRALQMGQISNLAKPERQNFLGELAVQLSRRKMFALDCLTTNQKAVAWNYGFRFAGNWFWYQPAMEAEFQQYSPGFCLLSKIIEEACDQPAISCVDLGLGAEEYKQKFVTDFQKTIDISIHGSKLNYCFEVSRYYLATCVKKIPTLDRWLRTTLRQRLSRLRRFFRDGSLGFLQNVENEITNRLFGTVEISFFQYCSSNNDFSAFPCTDIRIEPLKLRHLALAAREYFSDPETLTYLIRAAKRLQQENCEGFTVTNREGVPVQFCWVRKFAGFYMNELNLRLQASDGSLLLFDCWTPPAMRRRGFYAAAISNIARDMAASGQDIWIFCEAWNIASKKGIKHAGFVHRYSLLRRKLFGAGRVVRHEKNPSVGLQPAELVA